MSDPFVAEIRIFAGNYAPRYWAFCDGQLLSLSQNTALFSLLGTTYGGDGRTDFGLPDLRGRAPMHPGSGPGLTSRSLGQSGGAETVPLTTDQMAPHAHAMGASQASANDDDPGVTAVPAASPGAAVYHAPSNQVAMSPDATGPVGVGDPHSNLQPYLALHYIIATIGIYPTQS